MLAIRPTSVELRKTTMIVLPAINSAACHADLVVAAIGGVTIPDGVPTQVISAEIEIEVFELDAPIHDLDANPVVAEFAVSIAGNELETKIRAWGPLVRSVREAARTIIRQEKTSQEFRFNNLPIVSACLTNMARKCNTGEPPLTLCGTVFESVFKL